jgi:hypothetical protein
MLHRQFRNRAIGVVTPIGNILLMRRAGARF